MNNKFKRQTPNEVKFFGGLEALVFRDERVDILVDDALMAVSGKQATEAIETLEKLATYMNDAETDEIAKNLTLAFVYQRLGSQYKANNQPEKAIEAKWTAIRLFRDSRSKLLRGDGFQDQIDFIDSYMAKDYLTLGNLNHKLGQDDKVVLRQGYRLLWRLFDCGKLYHPIDFAQLNHVLYLREQRTEENGDIPGLIGILEKQERVCEYAIENRIKTGTFNPKKTIIAIREKLDIYRNRKI